MPNISELKLHIGCGPVIIEGWLNIDIEHPDAQLHVDVTQGMPFETDTVSFIFAEHFIEHMPRETALKFLLDCKRILTPGGVVRLSTPDLAWVVDSYFSRDTRRWGDLWSPTSPCRMINELFYNWGHQFIYDHSEIRLLLSDAGLINIENTLYRESKHAELCNLEARPYNNEIIIEATKK